MSLSTSRVTLDVGGVKFVTAASTLTANSAYFASLFSRNWSGSNVDGELFLDQDPVPFGTLLAYMRRGMIKVEDIDTDVLALAEFLGVEALLLAVKVRWYHNIGKGPVYCEVEEIAAAFDRDHGGIFSAISAGLFPFFLTQDDVNAEKDLATVCTSQNGDDDIDGIAYTADEYINGKSIPQIQCDSLVGALNGVFAKGYKMHVGQLDRHNEYWSEVTFSRRKHSVMQGKSTDIFIPADNEGKKQRDLNCTKQLAMLLETQPFACDRMFVPADIVEDSEERANPYATADIQNAPELWLQKHNFVTREEGVEKLFGNYIQLLLKHHYMDCRIYSRKIPLVQQNN